MLRQGKLGEGAIILDSLYEPPPLLQKKAIPLLHCLRGWRSEDFIKKNVKCRFSVYLKGRERESIQISGLLSEGPQNPGLGWARPKLGT